MTTSSAGTSAGSGTQVLRPSLTLFVAAVLLTLPWPYWEGVHLASEIPKSTLVSASACAGALLWLALITRTGRTVAWHPVWLIVLGFLIWAAISTNWSADRGNALIELTLLISCIGLAFVASQAIAEGHTEALMVACTLSGASIALLGVQQYFGFNPLGFRQHASPSATFINKNYAALYIDLVTPIALALLLSARHWSSRWLTALALGLCLSFLVLSGTRGSWLGLAVAAGGLVLALLARPGLRAELAKNAKSHSPAWAAAALLPLCLALIPSPTTVKPWTAEPAATSEPPDRSIQTRLSAYRNALVMIGDQPLAGVGYGGFQIAFRPYSAAVEPIPLHTEYVSLQRLHSDPLQILAELGIVGLALAAAIFVSALALAWRLFRAGGEERWLALGLFLALLASGAHAVVDFPLHRPASAALFWLALGLVLGLAARAQRRHIRPRRLVVALLWLSALAFSAHVGAFYWKYWTGGHLFMVSQRAIVAGDCPAALRAINESRNRFGLDQTTRMRWIHLHRHCELPAAIKLQAMDYALESDPYNVLARLTRGELMLAAERLDEAEQDFRIVAELLPHRASGQLGLGLVALKAGDRSKAERHFRTAKSLEGSSTIADKLLTELEKANMIGR